MDQTAIFWLSVFFVMLLHTSSTGAQQAPFTFNVAVDVKKLHKQVTDVHVRCAVYGDVQGEPLGLGENIHPIINRTFSGEVTVPVQMNSGENPESAQRYACRLRLIIAGGKPAQPSQQAGNIALHPATNADFIPLIEGNI